MLSISQMICLHEHQQKQPEQTSLGQSLDVVQWEGPVKRQVSVAEAEAGHRRGCVRQENLEDVSTAVGLGGQMGSKLVLYTTLKL